MTASRFRCPDCGDEMHPKFAKSHQHVWCPLIRSLMERDVDQLMDDIWWSLSDG